MISRCYLLLLSLMIATGNRPHQPEGFAQALQRSCKDHPFATVVAGTVLALIFSYHAVQAHSKQAAINVDLIRHDRAKSEINHLFVHGIADSHQQAYAYRPHIINGQLFTYDFPDVTQHFWRVNWTQSALGQQHEVAVLHNVFTQATNVLQKQDRASQGFVLDGVSRGATTILNFVGTHKPLGVRAIIAESPFDSTQSISNYKISQIGLTHIPGIQAVGHKTLSALFWQHHTDGICARDVVSNIDTNIPILLVCLHDDHLVPAESTKAIYRALRASGHTKTHLFVAHHGRHGKIIQGSDGSSYQAVVHAFYRTYGLPHDTHLADAGQEMFKQSQPK